MKSRASRDARRGMPIEGIGAGPRKAHEWPRARGLDRPRRPALPPGLRSAAGQLLTPSLCASPRLDNAHIAQDRLILLDAALCLFMINSLYCYIRFYKERYK